MLKAPPTATTRTGSTMLKAPRTAAVESGGAGGGVSTEATRRSERLLQGKKRSRYASPPSPAPARWRQATKRSHAPSQGRDDQEIVGGSADDAEAEFRSADLYCLTAEEMVPHIKRLYKKRANMGLAWYNKNHPEGPYEFTSVALSDVYNFMDDCVCYMHMNFKASNVTTKSEELFFAELALNGDVFDSNSGYSTTACSIVDGNCVGGKKNILGGWPAERYDQKHCYACDEKIKHPTGATYMGGHYAEDYMAGCNSDSD